MTWQSESSGTLTGTEGFATYQSSAGSFSLHWDDPFIGSDSLDVQVPAGFEYSVAGVQGNNIDATVVLMPPDS
ncbi:hypothetical protein AB0D08_07265 [Kitasatospora sp. NPDC048540]|uniref:hypothetical protein n=1 Tax=Kitasatospora sp. NPDC048540 TaxID=3155634 RepID=UPI0033E19CA3